MHFVDNEDERVWRADMDRINAEAQKKMFLKTCRNHYGIDIFPTTQNSVQHRIMTPFKCNLQFAVFSLHHVKMTKREGRKSYNLVMS